MTDPHGLPRIGDHHPADHDRVRTSDVLAAFRGRLPEGRVSLGDLIAALGDRSLGTVLLGLALPTVAPVPLGVSVLFNTPVLLFSLRLMLGRGDTVLPGWLLRRSIPSKAAGTMLDAVLPRLRSIEKLLTPRWPWLADIDGERWFGAMIFVLALAAFVPLPLTGWLPGFALLLLALGLIERDGGAVGAGLALGLAGVVFFVAVASGLSYAGHELMAKDAAE